MPSSSHHSPSEVEQYFEGIASRGFPYDDCRRLLGLLTEEEGEGLIPSFDLYFSTIAGYASDASRLPRWSSARITQAKIDLSTSFCERYPRFATLKTQINVVATPRLFAKFEAYEKIRVMLLELLNEHRGIGEVGGA
jgi:YxiJ-like protein